MRSLSINIRNVRALLLGVAGGPAADRLHERGRSPGDDLGRVSAAYNTLVPAFEKARPATRSSRPTGPRWAPPSTPFRRGSNAANPLMS